MAGRHGRKQVGQKEHLRAHTSNCKLQSKQVNWKWCQDFKLSKHTSSDTFALTRLHFLSLLNRITNLRPTKCPIIWGTFHSNHHTFPQRTWKMGGFFFFFFPFFKLNCDLVGIQSWRYFRFPYWLWCGLVSHKGSMNHCWVKEIG